MVTRIMLLLMLGFGLQGCSTAPPSHVLIAISGEQFNLEIVRDISSRADGMMHRTSFLPNTGMLFIFPEAGERSFWMKNCLIAIDLIFLDSRGTIIALHEMPYEDSKSDSESNWEYEQRLLHYWSYGPARFAIELEEGSIAALELRVNDRISLDLKYLKSIAR
jgi:uncharacterized membrane protein (UPF0127 family)